MKIERTSIVDAYSVRPAGKPEECFYCHEKLGAEHKPDCVIRNRTVKVRMTLDLVVAKPESWSEEQIEFHLNESSWCANNIIGDIDRLFDRDGGPCMCRFVKFEYAGEATAEDHEAYGIGDGLAYARGDAPPKPDGEEPPK